MNTDAHLRHIQLLEAQNRLLRRLLGIGCFCGLLLAALALAGWKQGVPDTIRANRFEVLDSSGKIVGSISRAVEGGGVLKMYNGKGVRVVDLGPQVGEGDGGMVLFDDAGRERFSVGTTTSNDGNYVLSIGHPAPRPAGDPTARAVQIGLFGNGVAGFRVYGQSSKSPRLYMELRGDETSEILMNQPGTGASYWRSYANHSEIFFMNAIAQGRDTMMGPSLTVNKPLGSLTSVDLSADKTFVWPKGP
jgi:hypothetical protein